MKTALGSSPRRSVGARAQSLLLSSPIRAVNRRLDFEDISLQETSALSGSGQPRGKRSNIYEIEQSPVPDESALQQEVTTNEDSDMADGLGEDTFAGGIGDETIAGADILDGSVSVAEEEEEEEVAPVVEKQPLKRGRKRKSDVLEPAVEEQAISKPKKQATTAQKEKKAAPRRRSNRISDVVEGQSSTLDGAVDTSEQMEQSLPGPKRRGRPPKDKPQPTTSVLAEKSKQAVFKKPELPAPDKPKPMAKPKTKANPKTNTTPSEIGRASCRERV